MREWKRGELQAFDAAAKFLLFIGLFTTVLAVSDRHLQWGWVVLGIIMAAAGLVLGIYLRRYLKATGKSARPFSK